MVISAKQFDPRECEGRVHVERRATLRVVAPMETIPSPCMAHDSIFASAPMLSMILDNGEAHQFARLLARMTILCFWTIWHQANTG